MTMFDAKFFDDIANRLAESVPASFKDIRDDLKNNFRSILQDAFSKLDLVTREEFDTQTAVLARTREKLDALEETITALESHLASPQKQTPVNPKTDEKE